MNTNLNQELIKILMNERSNADDIDRARLIREVLAEQPVENTNSSQPVVNTGEINIDLSEVLSAINNLPNMVQYNELMCIHILTKR